MLFDWLGGVFVGLAVLSDVILCLVIAGMAYLLRVHLALRPEGVALELRRLAKPLPPDASLPHVVVQIPTFNEGPIVERCIAAVTALDWPKDKLHIQVCDDSTDETTGFARAASQQAAAAGVDVTVLHREDRNDFKAGALAAAQATTAHDYFAILDVDYLPAPDFLRRCMTVLLAEPGCGFVQARIEFLNADENALTRAQAVMLDYHYGLEQATRAWGNHVLPFNGTCGIWRRAAMEAGGGWSGDTLSEDRDLSYRAWLKGWRGTYLTSVTVAGELPTRLRDWVSQQKRWVAGVEEVAYKTLPALVRNRELSIGQWVEGVLQLLWQFGCAMFAAAILLTAIAMILKPSAALALGLALYVILVAITITLFIQMRAANRFLRPGTSLWSFFVDFTPVPFLTLYISWESFRSLPATFLRRRRVFVRTPKSGVAVKSS